MALGVTLPTTTNITQFPVEPAIAAEREKLDTLGQQISSIVQSFNELKQTLVTDSREDRKAKFLALLDQRRAAIESAMDAWKQKNAQLGIAKQAPALAGLGQMDLTSIQSQISTEQSKLASLQAYYTAYKTALDAGQAPPPVPQELSQGFMGFSATTIIAGIALIAGAWYLFTRE